MNPQHLIEQAEKLIMSSGKPRQTDLRRSVSAVYYALFHLLTQAGSKLVSTSPLSFYVTRIFSHQDMKKISNIVRSTQTYDVDSAFHHVSPIPNQLRIVAETFVKLQELRHTADYDNRPNKRFSKADVMSLITDVRQAFQNWTAIETTPAARTYLLAMLLPGLTKGR